MVLILFPEEHIHPELSGRVLHSSPSRHGSISHHHFPITMDAGEGEHRHVTKQVSLSHGHLVYTDVFVRMCTKMGVKSRNK